MQTQQKEAIQTVQVAKESLLLKNKKQNQKKRVLFKRRRAFHQHRMLSLKKDFKNVPDNLEVFLLQQSRNLTLYGIKQLLFY